MSFQEYSESLKGRLHVGEANRKAVAGAIAILVAACGVVAFNLASAPAQETVAIEKADAEEAPAEEEVQAQLVCVHVGGCVARPGVVYLEAGARVADAVDAAGGATAEASLESVNLARAVEDGEQVIIQSAAEIEAANAASTAAGATTPSAVQPATSAAQGKVNLNTASVAELQTLSGIGESKAQKIVDYRNANGPYKSVDDLVNVSGIGEKTLDSIRSQICV